MRLLGYLTPNSWFTSLKGGGWCELLRSLRRKAHGGGCVLSSLRRSATPFPIVWGIKNGVRHAMDENGRTTRQALLRACLCRYVVLASAAGVPRAPRCAIPREPGVVAFGALRCKLCGSANRRCWRGCAFRRSRRDSGRAPCGMYRRHRPLDALSNAQRRKERFAYIAARGICPFSFLTVIR